MTPNRVLSLLFVIFLLASYSTITKAKELTRELIFGNPNSNVEVIEYMSLTCSHCANFHKENIPIIFEKFVNSGKIKFIFRDFPLDGIAYQAAIISHCVGKNNPERYYGFLNYLFQQQRNWAFSGEPILALKRMALIAGLNPKNFEECLKNKALGDQVLLSRQEAESKYKIRSTPTLIINGKVFPGSISINEFEKTIEKLLSRN